MAEDGGPSKKDLKKQAKKAEKQAKKNDPPVAASTTTVAPVAASSNKSKESAHINSTNILSLANVDDSAASLKVIWASVLYQVPLAFADLPNGLSHGPFLQYASEGSPPILVMGGNSMAKAVCLFSPTTETRVTPLVDEWCEWERTALRTNSDLATALAKLEQALAHANDSHHLVGHSTTVADICVCVTLASLAPSVSLPPRVATYFQSHKPALDLAQQALLQAVATRQKQQQQPTTTPIVVDMTNPSLLQVIEQVFQNALVQLFGPDVLADLPPNMVAKCSNPKHGDYQCNAAMPLFASLKKSNSLPPHIQKPPDVAKALVELLQQEQQKQEDHKVVITELQVNGPGFVLCRVASSFLQDQINAFLRNNGKLPTPKSIIPTTCLVDFSSPNIAKEMHVGHLRSTILGEAVCRILESVGHTVHRVNHVGDWGTQFGMLIQYLKEEYAVDPTAQEDQSPQVHNITDLTEFYKNAKQRFDVSPEFKKTAQTNVVRLQSGDPECLAIWKILCDVSRLEFQKVYDRLDITVEECGESFYNDKIPPVIEEFNQAGLISVEEGGAKCVFVEGFPIPLMLQKSDGGYGYDSTDMAALKYRLGDIGAKRIIVVTDFSQGDHFKMCYAAANKIGWVTDQKLEHIGFGTVQGEDGKRFKTRSGDTVRLVDLLDEAVGRMEASLKERIAENKANITLEEVHQVAEAIGYGAVKYFDLRRNPTTNYKFSYDQMLDTKGNTAVYLLYAHARLESICSKAMADYKVDVNELLANNTELVLGHPSERNLALHLQMFTDTLILTLDDLFPYHICEYLYNLSIAASDFATQCKVLGSPEMESRLLLCRATTMAMRECFDLLGIRHVERI